MELIAAAVIGTVVLILAAAGVGEICRRVHRRSAFRLRKRVIVSTHAGYGVEGVLYERNGRILVLRDARVTSNGEDRPPVPVDGELLLDRDQVVWVQVVN